jgi:hypothetical protein
MISIVSLWLPILLSAIGVFIMSSILHMVLKYHNNDLKKLPDEDKIIDDLRRFNIPPGDYMFPCEYDPKKRTSPEFLERYKKGPVGMMTVFPAGTENMAGPLAQWFVFCIIVGIFAAYVAGRALEPGAHYLSVFRFAGVTAFAGYSLAIMQQSIWFKRKWSFTLRSMFDGLIYALITAGFFGWLWPQA